MSAKCSQKIRRKAMKLFNFKQKKIASSVALILGSFVVLPGLAEENEQAGDDIEVIQVKGIRGSLIRSMDLKRDSSGVVDAISAEEMGKFPDTNLAESLGRITGVSVSRTNGEGSQITVRGFGPEFNLVTLNGRQMPGTGFTRSFSFENLSSEGVSTLEVQKTARAEVPTGGLGATVNIVTVKPLKNPGQKFSLMGKGIYDSSNVEGEDVTPEFGGVYSNTFFDEMFGFAVSFSHHRRDFQRQEANIQGWQANVDLPTLDAENVIDPRPLDSEGERIGNHFFAKDMNYGIANVQRERNNGQVTLQFAPTEDMVITADYTATHAITATNAIGWGIWNNFGANINGYELDENGTAIYADISGDDGSFTASRDTTEVKAGSLGINLDWQLTDDLHIELDYHNSKTEIDNGADKGSGNAGQVILGSDQLSSKIYDYRSGEVPSVDILWKNGGNEILPSEIDSNFSQFLHNPGESTVEQSQLHAVWANPYNFALAYVKFGIANTEQTMSGRSAWSGLRGGPGFNPSFVEVFPDDMFVRHDTGSFLDQFAGGGSALTPGYYYTFDYDEAVARQAAVLTEEVLGNNAYVPDAYYTGAVPTSLVEETTFSAYLQTEWDLEIGDFPVQLNAGIRYEKTEVVSPSESQIPVQVNWVAPSEWITSYKDELEEVTYTGEYDLLLPMLDIKIDLTDDIVGRMSMGKTITRPGLGNLLGSFAVSGSPKIGARTGSRGNPNLEPFQSTNLDFSFEYYYDESNFVALGIFAKEVDKWIDNSQVEITIDGIHDIYQGERWLQAASQVEAQGEQATDSAIFQQMLANNHGNVDGVIEPDSATDPLVVWTISSPENVDERAVHGIEFAIQHVFGESGYGFAVNSTFVDGDVTYDPDLLEVQPVLPGLSNSANLQLFYEKDGLSVKTTYSWRDKYLIGQGQSQGSSDVPPQFAKEFGQWDVSINYDVSEDLTVFFDGINLNNETEQGYGRYEEQFLFARQYGTRYVLGARYSF